MDFPHKLGIGFVLAEQEAGAITAYVESLQKLFALSYATLPPTSQPHLTLFQGKFRDEQEVIDIVNGIDLSYLKRTQPVKGVSVWDGKIVFLDTKKTADIARAHYDVFQALFPYCEGESADQQPFPQITDGQRRMFDTTGYPFSKEEYLPHFTLAHLAERIDGAEKRRTKQLLNMQLGESFVGRTVTFDRLVVYRVGEFGACSSFAYERKL